MSLHARAPLRIDFAGGWTDYSEFADSEGGCVVNAAIDAYVHADFLTQGKTIRLRSEDALDHVTVCSPTQLVYDGRLDRQKAALNMLPWTGGIEILSRSDVPPGSGLGEAAALDIALLAGLARCRVEQYDADELVGLAMLLERGELGMSAGRQDDYPAVFGGFLELSFRRDAIEKRTIALTDEAAGDLSNLLVLVYTGQSHCSQQTRDRIWDAYASGNARVVGALRGLRDVAREVRPALEAGDWEALAGLLNRNWEYQQQLDTTMCTPLTQSIAQALRAAGVWGMKATGDGAGGCIVAIGPPDRREPVVAAASAFGATVLDMRFTFEGVTVVLRENAAGNT